MSAQSPVRVSTLVTGAIVVTMDARRTVLADGALAIHGDRIVGVGRSAELRAKFAADEVIDGRRFVVTPGFVDAHIHITGDPLTRGYVPDDLDMPFADRLAQWVIPRFTAHEAGDEHVSAKLAALQMLRAGTTCFLEAGTVRHLDAVVEGLEASGIRARVGLWVEGRSPGGGPEQASATDAAIRTLTDEIERFPAGAGARIAAWPILVGHATNTDEVWRAARQLADRHRVGVAAHMSPYPSDTEWFLAHTGRRPVEHLADIGVLGDRMSLTHLTHVADSEVALLAATGTHAVLCPLAALRGAFGLGRAGRFPEMAAAGVNIGLGTDGDVPDLMQRMSLASGIFKDARASATVFPAQDVLAMAICGGARLMQLDHEIGSLEAGKKADFVLHDTDRPEWQPVVDVLHQLVWSADGRGVHSVWVDGVRVVENYRATRLDESALYRQAREAGREVLRRSGVPDRRAWPPQ